MRLKSNRRNNEVSLIIKQINKLTKTLYVLLFLIGLFSCDQKNKPTAVNENNLATIENKIPETIPASKRTILDSNFNGFKNLKIGMDISKLKNIEPTKEFLCFKNYPMPYDSKVDPEPKEEYRKEPSDVKSFLVLDKYTAFEKPVIYAYARFYKNKLYQISLRTKESLVFQLAEKLNIPKIEINGFGKESIEMLSLNAYNENILVSCYNTDRYNINSCHNMRTFSIDIVDIKVDEIVKSSESKKEKDYKKDF